MTKEEALARYNATLKVGIAICNAARVAASQAYDRELKPHHDLYWKRLNAIAPDDHSEEARQAGREAVHDYTEALIKLNNRLDAAHNKAEAILYKATMQAWRDYLLAMEGNEVAPRQEQLSLWETALIGNRGGF